MFTACGTMHRRCCQPALYHKLQTQFSAPEDGRNYRPKHVELIGVINKPLLLCLVCCLYFCISDAQSYKHQIYVTTLYHLRLLRDFRLPSRCNLDLGSSGMLCSVI